MIQAMARGVVGRELASDERNRQARINGLLLKALKRLGMPVLREWYKAAHDTKKVAGGCFDVPHGTLSVLHDTKPFILTRARVEVVCLTLRFNLMDDIFYCCPSTPCAVLASVNCLAQARMAIKIQARWRTFQARRKWMMTKTKVKEHPCIRRSNTCTTSNPPSDTDDEFRT